MKLSSTLIAFCFLSLLAWANDARANREEIVTGRNGGIPYLVVIEGEGNSTKQPGIYKRDLKNDWTTIIQGKVAVLDRIGGYIHQLELGEITKRADAFAVVDGKIVFFSAESNMENPASKILLDHVNQNGSLQVFLNNNSGPAVLPTISNGEDLAYYQKMMRDPESGKNLQVIVFSIRHANPMGNGVTFSLVFDILNEGKISLKTAVKPVVLDWEFIDSVTLNQRISEKNDGIAFLSRGVINKYAQERSPSENEVIKRWRTSLATYAQALTNSSATQSTAFIDGNSIPYFDLLHNQIKITSVPHIKFKVGNKSLYSVYDPMGLKSGVYEGSTDLTSEKISLDDLKNRLPIVQGDLTLNNYELRDSAAYASNTFSGNFSFLMDSKNNLHVLFISSKGAGNSTLSIKPLNKNLEYVSDVSYYLSGVSKYLLVSWKFKDGSAQTEVYSLKMSGNQLRVEDNLAISEHFYPTTMLAQRLHSIDLDKNSIPSFDDITQNVVSDIEYKQLHKLSKAHINLERSLKENTIIEFYPKASEEVQLIENISYRIFDDSNNKGKRTGLYIEGSENPSVITEIVHPQFKHVKRDEDESPVIENKRIFSRSNEVGYADTGIILTDDSFEKGANKIEVKFLISNKNKTESLIHSLVSFSSPVATIEKIETILIPHDSSHADQPDNLLVTYKSANGSTLFQVVKIYSPRAAHEKYKISGGSISKKPILEAGQDLTREEIESRLRVDKSGTIYWIKTPEVQFSDPDFRLFDLERQITVDPNKESLSVYSLNRKDTNESSGSSWRFIGSPAHNSKSGSISAVNNPLLNQPVSVSQFRTDMFAEFRSILEELGNSKKPAKRKVLIVPDSLRDYALGYPLALYSRTLDKSSIWTNSDHKLKLYVADTGLNKQEEVLKNLDSMRSNANDPSIRPVFIASLKQLISAARPSTDSSKNPFTLNEDVVDDITAESASSKPSTVPPHFLYMLATDGKHIGIEQFSKLNPEHAPAFSSLLIGTETEWNRLIEENSLEDKINLKKHFEVVKLEAPNSETRQKFVMEFLTRREIQSLNYKIDVGSFVGKQHSTSANDIEAKEAVAKYFVNRAEQLSHDNKEPGLVGFIKALNTFISELQKNSVIRNSKNIDRSTVEQILAKVFPVVLNLDILPDNDPIKRLSNRNAAWQWQQSGYGGALSFKQDIIKVILSQLVPDSVRSASSSIVVVGDSGSGKTAITRSLFSNYLGLKEYKMTSTLEDNEGAWYFHLACNSIRENNASGAEIPGSIPLDEAMKHIETFFASANGHRGFIVYDDLHLAPPKVRDLLISKIRFILENPTMPVVTGDTIPTRNITQVITLNYTNQHLLQKIAPNTWQPTVQQRILASLSHNDKVYDDSLLKRIGKVVVLDTHPQDAKAPQLRTALIEASKSTFNNSKVLNFISVDAITDVAKEFPKADARTFTSTAVANLVQLNSTRGHLVMVTPRLTIQTGGIGKDAESQSGIPTRVEVDVPKEIEKFIESNIEVIPIEKTQRGHIEFLKYMADSVRKYTFESLLKALNEDPRFAGSILGQQAIGAPSAKAIFDHLETVPYFPMNEINVDPAKMNAKSANEKNQFRRVWTAILQRQSSQDLQVKVAVPPIANIYAEFTTGKTPEAGNRSRQHVLKDSLNRIYPLINKLTSALMRVNDVNQLPQSQQWMENLNRNEVNLVQLAGTELANELAHYIQEMANTNLIENQREATKPGQYKITQYDTVRLYSMVIDKAIASLPWEAITIFMIHNLDLATKNLAQGHNPFLQHFLFESKQSILRSIDSSLVTGHAKSMPLFENISASEPDRLSKSFRSNCTNLLSRSLLE